MRRAGRAGAPPRAAGTPPWWRSPRAWWRSRTPVQRVELYIRSALYWIGAVAPVLLLVVLPRAEAPGWLLAPVLLTSALQGVATYLVVRAGLDARHAAQARPALVALTATTAAALALATGMGRSADLAGSASQAVVVYSLVFAPAAVSLVHRRAGWAVPLLAGALTGVSAALNGAPGEAGLRVAVVGLMASGVVVLTLRLSVWQLDVVHQLADARGDRARLAVAEERLRFARDLHDVVGRDLSAIALKSEVVARLAERGRPEAVAEAMAVRELAQSSLAEVRAVVRGHRRADLATELAGGRALLTSAGAACEMRVDDAAAAALPAPAQEELAWAVREAVTNVVRHARARACSVSLTVVEGAAVLVVRNDGVDGSGDGRTGPPLRPGAGLTGLRERLQARGGTLEVRRDGPRVELVATVPADDRRRGGGAAAPREGAAR